MPVASGAARVSARDHEAKVLHVLATNGGSQSQATIIDVSGLSQGIVRDCLRRLVKDGRVLAEGATRNRRYRLAGKQPQTELAAKVQTSVQRNASELSDRVSRIALRDRVLKAIAADADALNEDRLAQALEADRDEVAEACGWLLERDRVCLNPDGTYRRDARREMAA